MIKLIIFLLVGYFVLKSMKKILGTGPATNIPGGSRETDQIDNLMVQDPKCQTYISQRDAIQATADGQTLYFCSTQCRDAYLADSLKTR